MCGKGKGGERLTDQAKTIITSAIMPDSLPGGMKITIELRTRGFSVLHLTFKNYHFLKKIVVFLSNMMLIRVPS
jgi:hypothetical protein